MGASRVRARGEPNICAPAAAGEPRCGFTLIEILVAAALTVLLVGFIAGIGRNVGTTWSRTSGRLGTDAQARIVFDQLMLDLQGAWFCDDGNVWFAVDVLNNASGNDTGLWQSAENPKPAGGLSLQMTAVNIADARFGTAGVWLRFFTTSRGANGGANPDSISAPAAVGYQIIRRFSATNPASRETAYLLHRAEVRPAVTIAGSGRPGVLESGYDITNPAYTGEATAANSGAVTGDPRGILAPGSGTSSPRNLDSVLADNVIDFGVRCYVRDAGAPGGLRLVFPAHDARGELSGDPGARLRGWLPPEVPPNASNYNGLFPDVVDVMIRILTAEGAARLARLEREQGAAAVPPKYNHSGAEWWWGIAQEDSRVYARRIMVRAGLP
jgi:hypothetical protein